MVVKVRKGESGKREKGSQIKKNGWKRINTNKKGKGNRKRGGRKTKKKVDKTLEVVPTISVQVVPPDWVHQNYGAKC
jgi:hypothetical protein